LNLEAKDVLEKHLQAAKGKDLFARYYPA
jgi:hypothetical protein